jgi:hypothetical protein
MTVCYRCAHCYHRTHFLLPSFRCSATIRPMSRLTVPAWKCDRPECGWVWIAKGITPPEKCAKCKSRIWNRETLEGKMERVQEAVPAASPASTISSITLDAARRIIPPPIRNAPVEQFKPKPRCPSHRLPLVHDPEIGWWSCRVTKCRFRQDDDAVQLAMDTADFASI